MNFTGIYFDFTRFRIIIYILEEFQKNNWLVSDYFCQSVYNINISLESSLILKHSDETEINSLLSFIPHLRSR